MRKTSPPINHQVTSNGEVVDIPCDGKGCRVCAKQGVPVARPMKTLPACPDCSGPTVYNGNYYCQDSANCGWVLDTSLGSTEAQRFVDLVRTERKLAVAENHLHDATRSLRMARQTLGDAVVPLALVQQVETLATEASRQSSVRE